MGLSGLRLRLLPVLHLCVLAGVFQVEGDAGVKPRVKPLDAVAARASTTSTGDTLRARMLSYCSPAMTKKRKPLIPQNNVQPMALNHCWGEPSGRLFDGSSR